MVRYHIGVDSTDSATLGMCTTYLGARLVEALEAEGAALAGPPELVRLNPNVPWKTRGNGAVAVRCRAPAHREEALFEIARRLVDGLAVLRDPQTNPGLALVREEIDPRLRSLYERALHRIVPLEDALSLGARAGARLAGWKNGRGIIGALSAIGADLSGDHTWEVIAYREEKRYGARRAVSPESVQDASRGHPYTFFNVDPSGALMCVPRSPCPVLFGIRGTDPFDTLLAAGEVQSEPVERWVLWRTNQHTDAHIEEIEGVAGALPYTSVKVRGTVATAPRLERGGHLYFTLVDGEACAIRCAAYRQTGVFRHALARLVPGDAITVWGAVRAPDEAHPAVLNLEKIRIEACAPVYASENPLCPRCGGRMESMGKAQGLRCKKCRFRTCRGAKERASEPRLVAPGFVEPPQESWRHLYRPCDRPEINEPALPQSFWGRGPVAAPGPLPG